MDDWNYCRETLPKVSRTFALNISVLRGGLHRGILTAYLFCRIVDTVEDAAQLDAKVKIALLLEFSELIQNPAYRAQALAAWVEKCAVVDGSPQDLDLLRNTPRVFNVFNALPAAYRDPIIPSVAKMARGMSYFQKSFHGGGLTLLESENELEEYCYFVAGCVGEMLHNLFCAELPGLSEEAKSIMRGAAVSFGLGLQMTNISKDFLVDRKRGWSYIPRSLILQNGLTVEEFNSGRSLEKNLQVIRCLLRKTVGHLQDALRFTLALPRGAVSIRLFCIWPLWMAMETVAVLLGNKNLLLSEDPVKISRGTVKSILRWTPFYCFSNTLLRLSFGRILKRCDYGAPAPSFDYAHLEQRLNKLPLERFEPRAIYA